MFCRLEQDDFANQYLQNDENDKFYVFEAEMQIQPSRKIGN